MISSHVCRRFQSTHKRSVERVLVVGAGTIGLRTALELVRHGKDVIVRAPYHPLDERTCSMGAGGLWMPFHVEDDRVEQWSLETLNELLEFATSSDSRQGELVEVVPAVSLLRDNTGPTPQDYAHSDDSADIVSATQERFPGWTSDSRLQFQHLTVEMLSWQNQVYKLKLPPQKELKEAGYKYAWFFRPPIVDSPKMLSYFLSELSEAGCDVNVETREPYESMEEMVKSAESLGCQAVVNCTGLGAAKLCKDDKMVGARGILLQYNRSTCVRRPEIATECVNDVAIMAEEEPWGSDTMPCYMIHRGNTLVVGGSYLENDCEPSIRDSERKRLLQSAAHLGIDISNSKPVGEWTGFRPFRSQVRCEIDNELSQSLGITVVHSYGYGGSGWTLNVGAAKEVARILCN